MVFGFELMGLTCPHCKKEKAGYIKMDDTSTMAFLICRYCKKNMRKEKVGKKKRIK